VGVGKLTVLAQDDSALTARTVLHGWFTVALQQSGGEPDGGCRRAFFVSVVELTKNRADFCRIGRRTLDAKIARDDQSDGRNHSRD